MTKLPEGYEHWTVGDLKEFLEEYDADAHINITMYPSWRGLFVMLLWCFPFLDRWALKHGFDVLPNRPVEAIFTSDSGVDLG